MEVGRGSAVGTATDYGLDGPGKESRWRCHFPHPFRQAVRPTRLSVQWVPLPFLGGKAVVSWR